MSNAAYTEEYRQYWSNCQPLFSPEHLKECEKRRLSDEYCVHISEYSGNVGKWNLRGSACSLVDSGEKVVANWHSIDDRVFYKIIQHSDGKEYLIFRQDLYGYSVLDIASGARMQFFPEASLKGGETFIWTDIAYSPETNTLAAIGCYWACPFSVHLVTFEKPMSERQTFVDLYRML